MCAASFQAVINCASRLGVWRRRQLTRARAGALPWLPLGSPCSVATRATYLPRPNRCAAAAPQICRSRCTCMATGSTPWTPPTATALRPKKTLRPDSTTDGRVRGLACSPSAGRVGREVLQDATRYRSGDASSRATASHSASNSPGSAARRCVRAVLGAGRTPPRHRAPAAAMACRSVNAAALR